MREGYLVTFHNIKKTQVKFKLDIFRTASPFSTVHINTEY